MGDRVFLKILPIRGVMQFGKEVEVGIQGCLTPRLDNSFSQDYTWTVYLSLFWLKGQSCKKELVFLYMVVAWIPIDPDCVWNYLTWVLRLMRTSTV